MVSRAAGDSDTARSMGPDRQDEAGTLCRMSPVPRAYRDTCTEEASAYDGNGIGVVRTDEEVGVMNGRWESEDEGLTSMYILRTEHIQTSQLRSTSFLQEEKRQVDTKHTT